MRFGVGHFTLQRPPGDIRPFRELYGDLLYFAELIDAVGLESIWVTEHHFAPDGYVASLFTVCSAMAARTQRVALAPGVLAPLYHPLRLAEDSIALDLLSNGRSYLGLGVGYRAEEYEGLGVPFVEATARFEESLEVLALAMDRGSFSHVGPHFQFDGVQLTPGPLLPGGPPWVMMGGSEAAARRAARLGCLYMGDPAIGWEELARLVELYDSKRSVGALELPLFCYGFVAEADPWRQMEAGFIHLREMYDGWMGKPLPVSRDPRAYRLLLGGHQEVIEQVESIRQRFGDRVHLVLRLDYPGMSREVVAAAIRGYGRVAETFRTGGESI